jgi:hypothetical protein
LTKKRQDTGEDGMSKIRFYFSVMLLTRLCPHSRFTRRIRLGCQRQISEYFRARGH